MSNRGPSLRHIAAWLREKAAELPERRLNDGDTITLLVPDTRLRITCGADRASVMAVAERYRKGLPAGLTHTAPRQRSSRRQFQLGALRAFLEDGEWDNARAYLDLFPGDDKAQLAEGELYLAKQASAA